MCYWEGIAQAAFSQSLIPGYLGADDILQQFDLGLVQDPQAETD